MSEVAQTLSPQEAQDFVRDYWGKKPVVLHRNVLVSPAEVFQALVRASDMYRVYGSAGHRYALYVNGMHVAQGLHHYLPMAGDENPAGYERRLWQLLRAESFALFVSGVEAFSPAMYASAQGFLRGLYEFTGTPGHLVELELFLGRYHSTPGGIHNEECHNLHWVIDGEKTLYTWPEMTPGLFGQPACQVQEATSKTEENYLYHARPQDFLAVSIPLRGRGGDILYWPRRYWHVGESQTLSLSISIRLYMEARPDLALVHHWKRL